LNKQTFFSVLIPAKGRPEFLRQAIMSVLLQDFDNFELIISNNGGDQRLRDIVQEFGQDPRLKYMEQENVLNMPAHWETISRDLEGEYLLILTDRSLFRKRALYDLHTKILELDGSPEVISWPWDLYLDHIGILTTYPNIDSSIKRMDPIKSLLESINNNKFTHFLLPRGLNSCVRVDFMEAMRARYGQVFKAMSPDYTFAYLCLLNTESFYHLKQPLFVSQGVKVSNGGNAYASDARGYLSTLDIKPFYEHVPLKLPLVLNLIHGDFMAMLELCGRNDLIEEWDRVNYFDECTLEVEEKRKMGILTSDEIIEMEKELEALLALELPGIRTAVTYKNSSNLRNIRLKVVGGIKNIVMDHMKWLYRWALLLTKRTSRYYDTAMEAAGFDRDEKV